MRMFFFIFLIFNATVTFAKETFLECTIQGKKTTLTNAMSEVIISPSKASVQITEIENDLIIFVRGPQSESTTVATHKLDPNDSYENLSTPSEYKLIYVSEKEGTLIKIDRVSGLIVIEGDFKGGPNAFIRTRLHGNCNKIDKLKF